MLTLGRFSYPQPLVVLAPMAGVSDLPFRQLCQRFGADFTVAEMVSAKPDLLATGLSQRRLAFDDDRRFPRIVQLLGADPALMAAAAQRLVAAGADVIDVNLGCPAAAVAKRAAGSALLADLPAVDRLLRALRAAVAVPLTLKTRLGDRDKKAIFTVMMLAAEHGFSLIALHGRTRAQRFSGPVDYDCLGRVAEQSPLPVLANGDIGDAAQVAELLGRYPLAGVMIGRASQGRPQLFAQCQNRINGRGLAETLAPVLIRDHLRALQEHYGPAGLLIGRRHLHHYLRPRPDYEHWRPRINAAADPAAQLALGAEIWGPAFYGEI